jgi:alkanesulfonate monooxygenase SsuD/methylene tetrahydromethanopterin reductase-like flavin-dependent oxidoreductase (luciferase family)
MASFRLGFLTHVEGRGDLRQVYEETLELFVAADELGFDVGWVAQHHFKREGGSLPSPFPFLAAAAQRTKNIRLGTSVVVLPFENPLRVAEDAAVVDTLSGGRLELGVGSGLGRDEFAAFGVDIEQRSQLTVEGLKVIQHALRGGTLGTSSHTLLPPPGDLIDRIWQGSMSLPGTINVAKHGVGLMLARSAIGAAAGASLSEAQWPLWQAYLDNWDEAAHGAPRLAISRGIFPAESKQAALDGLRDDVTRFATRIAKQRNEAVPDSLEQICDNLNIAYGSSEDVIANLSQDALLPYANDLILQFNPATPAVDVAIRQLEQIATEIAPALGWQPRSSAVERLELTVA